jgi:hypothetical protein
MTQLDWIMVGVYLVIAVIISVRAKVCGVGGVERPIARCEWIMLGIGTPTAIYLIIRHPWYCLIWACVGSLIAICMAVRKLNRGGYNV